MADWGIIGSGAYAPATVIDNEAAAAALTVAPQWILDATGIRERRRAASGEAASDLAAHAARAALRRTGLGIADIGLIVVGTSTPDELGPSTACRVQALLGARGAVALDVGAACAGYLFGLSLARDWLAARPGAGYALVIGVEVYSRFLDPRDRSTAVIFGDGAGASIVGPVADGEGIRSVRLGSDGTRADAVLIPAGGSRRPFEPAAQRITMDAKAIRKAFPELFDMMLAETLAEHRIGVDGIDLLVPHQPNPRTLRMFAEDAGIPLEKVVVIGDRLGNIGAGSIPTALAEAAADGRLKPGQRVLLMAIGAGLTWGSILIHWPTPPPEGAPK
ncbi:3-oxoacyl-ACP synthase III family protein [Glycomyces tritici]|uniref:Ketoacyl-ACP synthase III n=1 Tax=Glycomyces tritici TaxID=2665176 RepID=A0ABT7YWS6_9ACTN|nr:ketoacyl-ACP synthase III [Glycomyces tritici]MDN3243087.1 ketoacyl-ACP synthase III [Glycomyces tritici]